MMYKQVFLFFQVMVSKYIPYVYSVINDIAGIRNMKIVTTQCRSS